VSWQSADGNARCLLKQNNMNMKDSDIIKLLCIFLLSLYSENCFSQLPFQLVVQPQYRVVKEKHFQSKDFSIPEVLNDSTVTLNSEVIYTYSTDKMINKKTFIYRFDGNIDIINDSIVYITADSVIMIRSYMGKTSTNSKKLVDYIKLIQDILGKKIKNISLRNKGDAFYREYEFSVSNGELKKLKEIQKSPDNWHVAKYFYLNHKLDKIEHKGKYSNKIIDKSVYHNQGHYELSISNGVTWCCSFHYYFNDEGYLLKSATESDTNASITVYEYENKAGNMYQLYYDLERILNAIPIIY
jgi:hypothetical protein